MNLQQIQISCNRKLKSAMEIENIFASYPYIKRDSILSKIIYLSFTLFIFFTYHVKLLLSSLFTTFSLLTYFILIFILGSIGYYSFKE